MGERVYNVLFLCTGNSARSIIAEAILNREGQGQFRAESAGSTPVGELNPHTIRVLQKHGHDVSGLHSKSWNVFSGAGAPKFDFVITVCDAAVAETCPVWPGKPMTTHWGIPDPANAAGPETEAVFEQVYTLMAQRVAALVALPIKDLFGADLWVQLRDIGRMDAGPVSKAG